MGDGTIPGVSSADPVTVLTAAAARRAVLAAQGFADPRPAGAPTRRHLARVLERTKLIQLDSVNVAVRAHYAPAFARLGGYPIELLDEAAWSHSARRPRRLVEYWAHEASLLPVEDWPLLRWRMRKWQREPWRRAADIIGRAPGLVDDVLAAVGELGPIGAGALERAMAAPARGGRGTWWDRSETKIICEQLFGEGRLTTGARRGFQRLYELTERVVPPQVLATDLDDAAAAREMVRRSAAALGVATEPDLRDYYRISAAWCRRAVAELVEDGALEPVTVRGWNGPAYRHPGARLPRTVRARALLCPFDPLIWDRARTERLFDVRYRIEIYTPAPKRVFGYYVFLFLLDERLVARVDLKADRASGVLRVPGVFAEPGIDLPAARLPRVLAELAEELQAMAGWLGLDGVEIGERGDLAAPLAAVLRPNHSTVRAAAPSAAREKSLSA